MNGYLSLFDMLEGMTDIEREFGDVTGFLPAEVKRLRAMAEVIVFARGGVEINQVDFDDAASGALVEHAYGVVRRELLNRGYHAMLDEFEKEYPMPPRTR